MDLGGINPVILLASLMVASTPILFASLGELVVEKSGVLNLGVEGMMIFGAICGFIAAVETQSPAMGFAAAALGGAALSMLFGLLTQIFLTTQVPAGLALTLLGTGLASLLGQNYQGMSPPRMPDMNIPVLEHLPVIGPILFQHDAIVYLSLIMVFAVWGFLKFTRAGLVLRAVGENHGAAHALGYKVKAVRFASIAFGGAMAGLGGAYISLVRVPQWTDGITAGIGWIALAIVVFASWRPGRLLIGAYLFGGITVLQLNLQAAGIPLLIVLPVLLLICAVAAALINIVTALVAGNFRFGAVLKTPLIFLICAIVTKVIGAATHYATKADTLLLSMSPFLATILVLVVISARRHGASDAPAMLGRIFHTS